MSKWFKIIIANTLALVVLVGGLGILGFYIYENNKYISTDDARISANTINITALTAGKIVAWNVKPGDLVSNNSTLGTQQAISGSQAASAAGRPTSLNIVQDSSDDSVVKAQTTPDRSSGSTPAAPDGTGLPSGTSGGTGSASGTLPIPGTSGTAGSASGARAPFSNSTVPSQAPGTPGGTATVSPASIPIKAPIRGTIIQNIVDPGQIVAPGQPLAMIADLSKVYVIANINETKITDVKPGQSVDINLDAYPADKFTGRVEVIIRATASTFSMIPTGTTSGSYTKVVQKIPVQISIGTMGREILPGMSATVRIEK